VAKGAPASWIELEEFYLGCGFKHFLCSPLLGDMIQFEMG